MNIFALQCICQLNAQSLVPFREEMHLPGEVEVYGFLELRKILINKLSELFKTGNFFFYFTEVFKINSSLDQTQFFHSTFMSFFYSNINFPLITNPSLSMFDSMSGAWLAEKFQLVQIIISSISMKIFIWTFSYVKLI